MRWLGGVLGRILLACLVAAALAYLASRQHSQRSMTAVVPAYFYPAGTGARAWDGLCIAAHSIQVRAILNPASGPGIRADPNYSAVVQRLRSAGGRILGYVHTSYAAREIGRVQSEIEAYIQLYDVDGFFIDEMATDPLEVSYYAGLYAFIKSRNQGYEVVGNPGTSTDEQYLRSATADILVLFEGTAADFKRYRPSSWVLSYPPRRFAAIIHGAQTAEDLRRVLASSIRAHVEWLFVTNGRRSNPYDHLPPYWDREVAALKGSR